MSAQLNENSKRGRLWIEDQIISGAKLEETLEEYGISIGQVIYVEYSNNSNQWPTENMATGLGKNKSNTSSTSLGNEESQKTNGLYNLGNSKLFCLIYFFKACYMNSALQCLANTKFFNEYFIKEKKYLTQMNLKNK
jgi:uncharacterized UBP type Zn finger protein